MRSSFPEALALVLAQEGGLSDDPRDPGGRTNRGLTQATYDAWRRRRGQPSRSVAAIGPAEVEAIYRRDYADPLRFDDLPAGIDYAAFDAGVNSGVRQAARWLASAAGQVPERRVGNATLEACRHADAARLIDGLCDRRLGLLRHLPTWAHFGLGWSRRVSVVRRRAKVMAAAAALQAKAA